ncbi:MAG: hypothetical protein WDM79_16160 [Terricaulis sp.]
MTDAASHPNSSSLWRIAREMFSLMLLALGAPTAIASIPRLNRKNRRDILDWLEPLELLVRKLLLVEAAKLPREAERRTKPRALTLTLVQSLIRRKQAQKRRAFIDPHRPATWRAHFRLSIPADTRYRPPRDASTPRIRDIGQPYLVSQIWSAREAQGRETRLAAQRIARAQNTPRAVWPCALKPCAVSSPIPRRTPSASRANSRAWPTPPPPPAASPKRPRRGGIAILQMSHWSP